MKKFKDKVAVITGAASGIGLGIAGHCAKEGMKVVIADIEENALSEAENRLKAGGASVVALRTDVSKPEDIETLAGKTIEAFGAVHLLFNNAGVQTRKTTWESTLADWEWVINVNLWGVIHGLRTFVPIMLSQQTECHIVNTASLAGLIYSGDATYKVTKAGIIGLSETLYLELKQRNTGIGVSVLIPAFVRSRLNEAARNRQMEYSNPKRATPASKEELDLEKLFYEMNERGMTPEECAKVVFEAIRQDKFYIFNDPGYNKYVKERMESILSGRNPEFPQIFRNS